MIARGRSSGMLIAAAVALVAGDVSAQVSVGLTMDEGGVRSFHASVGAYFGMSEVQVTALRGVDDDELPVVLFIASRARVAPAVVLDLRRRGMTWFAIAGKFGLGADVFYVPVDYVVVKNTPYGRAYGYYRKPRAQWKTIVLADDDVVNLVNLRFFMEHYKVPAAEVVRLRAGGKRFAAIHAEKHGGKGMKPAPHFGDGEGGSGKGGGKGKGKRKGGR